MITAKDIQEQGFEHSRKGYDVEEVDIFLERVANDVDALTRQNQDLRARVNELSSALEEAEAALAESEKALEQARAETASASPAPVVSNEEVATLERTIANQERKINELNRRLEQKNSEESAISAAIISAQKSADAIREESRLDGERIYREAENKAREIVRDALSDKQAALNDLEQLKAARDAFREEYQSLLDRFVKQADEEFKSIPRTNGPIDDDEVAAQEKAAFAELRHATGSSSSQQAIPVTPDTIEYDDDDEEDVAVPAASGKTPDFTAFGDTTGIDLDEID